MSDYYDREDFTVELSMPPPDANGWISLPLKRIDGGTEVWSDGRLVHDSKWTWKQRLQVKIRFALERLGIIDRPELRG